MICNPHWTAYLSALLVPTVAGLGLLIAYRQWRTAQNKLKLDLFERRFSVYDAARNLIGSIMTSGEVKSEEVSRFLAGTREAKWLFDAEVAMYLDERLYQRAITLQNLDAQLDGVSDDEERAANVIKQLEIKDWIRRQYDVLDEKFSGFLKLEH